MAGINTTWDLQMVGRIQSCIQLLSWDDESQGEDAETTIIDFPGSSFQQTGIAMIIGASVIEVTGE
jgi:hypothetical protein